MARIDGSLTAEQKAPKLTTAEGMQLIRHIVFFSARRKEDVSTIQKGLSALAAIPHSTHFEVAVNEKVDPLSDEVDVVVYAEFPDAAALEAYKAHPIYDETTRRVRPLREMRYSADFVASAG